LRHHNTTTSTTTSITITTKATIGIPATPYLNFLANEELIENNVFVKKISFMNSKFGAGPPLKNYEAKLNF